MLKPSGLHQVSFMPRKCMMVMIWIFIWALRKIKIIVHKDGPWRQLILRENWSSELLNKDKTSPRILVLLTWLSEMRTSWVSLETSLLAQFKMVWELSSAIWYLTCSGMTITWTWFKSGTNNILGQTWLSILWNFSATRPLIVVLLTEHGTGSSAMSLAFSKDQKMCRDIQSTHRCKMWHFTQISAKQYFTKISLHQPFQHQMHTTVATTSKVKTFFSLHQSKILGNMLVWDILKIQMVRNQSSIHTM